MTGCRRHILEEELHAFVDNMLPGHRRGIIEAWLATHPEDAARVAAWRSQRERIRAHYAGISKESTPVRLDLKSLPCAFRSVRGDRDRFSPSGVIGRAADGNITTPNGTEMVQ
jgi:anti-sigma factor RsiW